MANADSSREEHEKQNFSSIQKVADLSPNIFFVLDLQENQLLFISKKVKDLFGYEPKDFLDQGTDIFRSILHPDDYEPRLKSLENCRDLFDEEECVVEVRLRTKEDKWEWYKIRETIFKQDSDKVSQVLGIAQNIHEQKIGEEKLREEHRRLADAQAIGHIGSFERMLPGNIMVGSEEFFNILGIKPRSKGLTIEEFYSFVHPEDHAPLLDAVNRTHATGQPVDTVTRIIRPDKSVRHIHRRVALIKDERGNPLRVYGTIQDITGRVKANEERLKAEDLMRSTESLAGMGSYELDLATNAIYFSDGLYRIFGEEPGSFIPSVEWINQRTHPEDVPLVDKIINQAIAGKTDYTYTRRIYRKDGALRMLEANGRFISKDQAEKTKIVGLVQDVTERNRAEEEIRRSEDENRNLLRVLQNAPDSYLVLSPVFRIIMVNDSYLHATHTIREDIVGKYIFDVFPDNPELNEPTSVKSLKASLEKVLKTKKLDRLPILQYDVPNGNGGFIEKYWIPTNSPVLDAEGEVEYIIHRALDITDLIKEKAITEGLVSETEMLKTSLEEIKVQAQQLKESRAFLQSVFDSSPNSIILFKTFYNSNGKPEDFEFFMVNAYNYQTLGIPPDVIGKKLSEIFPEVSSTQILDKYKETAETGKPVDFEEWYEGQGIKNWFHFRAVKLDRFLLATAEDITERKRAETELISLKEELTQRVTDKYRKIVNSMDEGFCLLEIIRDDFGACVDYRYLEVNPVFEAQSGMKNVIGKTINELLPGNENHWKEIYGKVALTGESIRMEDYAEVLERWFDVNAFRINDPNAPHVAVMFKDITVRKETEERNNFLLELNDAISNLDDPGKIQKTAMCILGEHLQVNRAYFSEILSDGDTLAGREGYEKDVEPVSRKTKISEFSPKLHEQFQEGKTIVLEDIFEQFKYGKEAEAFVKNSNVRAAIIVPRLKMEKIVALISIHQISKRKWTYQEVALVEEVSELILVAMEKAEAGKALRESEQRFRHLVEASAIAIWETDPRGRVVKDSPSWRNFTGQTFDEWIGEGWVNAIYPDDREYATQKWEESIATQKKFDTEFRVTSASGEARWTSIKATPIYNVEGKVTKWSGMNIDIQDRKMAEEALIKAKEEAEAASRAKEDFLSTMSHEIRTPLNAVIGLTHLLLDKNPREDQVENLSSLSFSAKNLLALINNILDFSKLEAGKAELNITDFDFPLLLLNLKQAHQPQAHDRQTKIVLQIDGKIPDRIAADQLKLSQVLHNLVSNAVKFTSNGKVFISVNLKKQEQDTYWLDFEVRDTGIGISEEKLEHIFEKFTQAESSTVRQYGGTGLGLSITRLLLEILGSEIKLDSTPGEGSRFYFSLAVKKAKHAAVPVNITPIPETVENRSNFKILLVEDVEINRKIIIQFLQNWWQMKPDEARNGMEALEMALKNKYDLILMDIRMPVMDGYEATQQIRTIPGYENTPILALTADKNQEVQQADYHSRFSGLLTKPFEPLDLKKKILHHLPVTSTVNEDPEDNSIISSEDAPDIDPESRKEFMELILFQLKEYRESFLLAIKDEDKRGLEDLNHKSKLLFKLLKLNSLSEKLDQSLLLPNGLQKEKRQAIFEEGNKIFEKAIKQVQKEISEPVFEVSRYSSIAGENKTIFQKLINNSIKSLELYQQEFDAAAKNRNQEELSNLVHKNTTSLHYLQANRLASKIEEFRGFLKGEDVPDIKLQKKQEEVIKEFYLVITGLKDLVA